MALVPSKGMVLLNGLMTQEDPGLPQHSSHMLGLNQNPFTQTAKPPKAQTQSDTPLIQADLPTLRHSKTPPT